MIKNAKEMLSLQNLSQMTCVSVFLFTLVHQFFASPANFCEFASRIILSRHFGPAEKSSTNVERH